MGGERSWAKGELLTPAGVSQPKEETDLPRVSRPEARTGDQEIPVGWMLERKKGDSQEENTVLSVLLALESMRLEVVTPSFMSLTCLQSMDGGPQLLGTGHGGLR